MTKPPRHVLTIDVTYDVPSLFNRTRHVYTDGDCEYKLLDGLQYRRSCFMYDYPRVSVEDTIARAIRYDRVKNAFPIWYVTRPDGSTVGRLTIGIDRSLTWVPAAKVRNKSLRSKK